MRKRIVADLSVLKILINQIYHSYPFSIITEEGLCSYTSLQSYGMLYTDASTLFISIIFTLLHLIH